VKLRIGMLLLALVLVCAVGYASEEDLLVHYDFEKVKGIAVNDASPNNVKAYINGTVSFVDGIDGKAAFFEGVDGFLKLPDGFMEKEEEITIAFWIKMFEFKDYTRIIQLQGPGGEYLVMTWGNGVLYAYDGSGAFHLGVEFPQDTWFHFAVTNVGNQFTYYINGEVVHEYEGILSIPGLGTTETNWIGKSLGVDPYLHALMDEFRVYGRALTPEEIVDLYEALEVE